MSFQREVGAIISPQGQVLKLFYGQPTKVNFSIELAWRFHQEAPGIVHLLMRTHPVGSTGLSHEDKLKLRTWAFTFKPFPIRIGIITKNVIVSNPESINDEQDYEPYVVRIFYGDLESKEEWVARVKQDPRKFQIIEEEIDIDEWVSRYKWINQLWSLSCYDKNK